MLHLLKIMTCVLLIQDLHTMGALAIDGCVETLTNSLTNGADTCSAVNDYVKCFLLETHLYKTQNTNEVLRQLKRQIEDPLAEKGIICHIDVMAIAQELLENDKKGIQGTTTRPTGYNNAKNIGDCLDTFTAESSDNMICARLTPYLKCLIRVTNLYAYTSSSDNQESQTLERNIKVTLRKLNITCDFKLASLIEEVRREQSGENGSNPQQGNGRNGTDMVLGSLPFVTLFILTCASVFMLL